MKLNQLTILTGLIISLFSITTNSYGYAGAKEITKTKFISHPTGLAAKSFALKKFGRNINVLSNRLSKKSGCFKIVLKTRAGDRKALKICHK